MDCMLCNKPLPEVVSGALLDVAVLTFYDKWPTHTLIFHAHCARKIKLDV